jgi:NSS family neurotransmitter:Na+ symporter
MSNFDNHDKREGFSSKFGIIAAAAGSAIGLGNIWRFPYLVGENGGAAFVFIYLIFVFGIGVPVMLSELIIGRKAQSNYYGAFRKLAPGTKWSVIGIMGVASAFMILSFYSVVAGWTLEYVIAALDNTFAGKSPAEIKDVYGIMTGTSWRSVLFMLIFMALTAFIVQAGVQKGIERASKALMPVLFVIVAILIIRSLTLEGAAEGLRFLFNPDFSKVSTATVMDALGQAFFSLSLGMGAIATYGSYISKKESLGQTAVFVSLFDTIFAVLVAVAIFPAVFAFGLEPGQGPGLVFVTFPGIFNQMAGGYFFAIIFFVLLAITALTSTISLLEVVVVYFVEELKMKRGIATWVAAGSMSALGALCAVNTSVFSFFDSTSSNILLPLGGLLTVIFVGWILGKKVVRKELEEDGKTAFYFKLFIPVIRFIAPIAIAMVFLNGMGLLKF